MTNMKKINFYIGLCSMLLITVCLSCRRELDVKPASSLQVPSSAADFQALLDNTSSISQVWPYSGIAASDDGFVTDGTWQQATVTERNAYLWQRNVFNDQARNDWSLPYNVILLANIANEGAEKYGTASALWNNIRGQALFLRGFALWQLAQVFCKSYDAQSVGSDLGLVLRTSSDLNIKSVRSRLQQTYDRMIADLAASVPLLPVTALTKTRPCRAAAYAMLARTYLSMRRYPEAGLYADSSLQLNNSLLDYNMFSAGNGSVFPRFNAEVLFHSTSFGTSFLLPPKFLVDTTLYKAYDDNDLRKTLLFSEVSGSSWHTFNGSYDGTIIPFNGPATDEMYLVRAEAAARAGRVSDALKDLNTLRQNRFKTGAFEPLSGLDPAGTLNVVLLERRKELLLRGLRWTDLRRLNREPALAVTLKKVILGTVYTLPPSDARYVFPIPQQVINDTGMQQN